MMKIPSVHKGLKARFFAKIKEELPPVPSVGDIVLLRNCKVTTSIIHFLLDHLLTLCAGYSSPQCTIDSRCEEIDKHDRIPSRFNTRARLHAIISW